MKLKLDQEIARAAALDKAKARMRKQGRKIMDREDWHVACAEFERLYSPLFLTTEELERGSNA